MNVLELKAQAIHWATPLVKPVVAVMASAAAADSMQLRLPINVWVEALQLVVVVLVLRTILFFEFMVHERKEQRLYQGVLKTGDSFDRIWEAQADRIKKLEEWQSEVAGSLASHGDQLADHTRQLKELQAHPLLRRPGKDLG